MTSARPVRVVVVNYNGGAMTLNCLETLGRTQWPSDALQIVLVDNGSTDGIAAAVADQHPEIDVVRSDVNLGFAGGVNLGLRELPPSIGYVALLNNDATVGPGWLGPLVAALESSPSYGAACPKVLFADPHEELEILGPARRPAWCDRRAVTVRVAGARADGEDLSARVRYAGGFLGPEFGPDGDAYQWASPGARLLLPARPPRTRRELSLAAPRPTPVTLRTARAVTTVTVGRTPRWYALPEPGDPFDVINNVGSEVQPDGYAHDRGYLERDRGQYDQPTEVFAWYGGAVLLRASYLRSLGGFDDRLFAYYEDIELAWRGHRDGWRYVTVPASVVRHRHMATLSTRTPWALYLNERNRLLVLSRFRPLAATARTVLRFVAITASYARRDVLGRWLSLRRAAWTITAARVGALADCCRMWAGRRPRHQAGRLG